ncbi:MAG: hypothetical protein FJ027_05090 [Candidatus Rokubacteria bacterium]|nr:hypothetical protein [Candidatus Rokubacteria bacterium]
MSTTSVAPALAARLDRKIATIQHVLGGMEHAGTAPSPDDLRLLAELTQEARDVAVELRLELDVA